MNEPKVIVFAGLPLTGKSTLAKLLEDKLKISRMDVDEIRHLLFKHYPVDTERDREQDGLQMRASWKSLFALTDNLLEAGRSVVVAGTFSRRIYHQRITTISKRRKALLQVVFCYAPEEVILQRIRLRNEDKNNPSLLKTMEGYNRVRARYVKILVPNLLDLCTSKSIESCLAEIIDFVS